MTRIYDKGFLISFEEILKADNEQRLVNLLRDCHVNVDIINSLVNDCVELGASKCLITLIRGEVCNTHPTFNAAKLPESGVTPLAYIAHSCPQEHQVIDLIFTKCGGTCLANVYCTIGVFEGLPIHFLLVNFSVMEHLHLWNRCRSIVKLVILLCLWETKPILDSLRVLVNHTDSINTIAWNILSNGGLKQFAALLLIAREEVIAPFDTGLTIHQYITNEINLVPEDKASYDQVERKCVLRDAQTLLALFELAGDDLSSYCSSMQKYVSADDVVADIGGLLIKHQVRLIMEDIDLFDCRPKGYVGRAIPDPKDYNSLEDVCYIEAKLEPRPALPRTSAYSIFYDIPYCWPNWAPPIPSCLQGRLYSTRACQVGKMSMSLPRTAVSPTPRRLGYFAMKYIGRVRFLG